MAIRNKTETLRDAIAVHAAAEADFLEHAPQFPLGVPETPEWEAEDDRLQDRMNAAAAAVEAARSALYGSDCPRPFALDEAGATYEERMFSSVADALRHAIDGVDRNNYDFEDGRTLYIDVRVVCALTGEQGDETVVLNVPEPPCVGGFEHDWRSPIEVVGGCRENPGVFGHGGGVTIREVCSHCGRYRIEDTWAQRPDTGEQGLRETTYEEPDAQSLAWIEELRGEDVEDD